MYTRNADHLMLFWRLCESRRASDLVWRRSAQAALLATRTDLKALNQKRKGLDTMARILYKIFDYVIRRFNAPSAGLKAD